jgi:putative transposase
MIDRNHRLALTTQSALLGISRGSVYYEPAPVSDADLALMRRLDELNVAFSIRDSGASNSASSRMMAGSFRPARA